VTREEANHLVEGDRVKARDRTGTVIGTITNRVSIQWDGREAREIFTADDMRHISKAGEKKMPGLVLTAKSVL
jgi:hypothetical protein